MFHITHIGSTLGRDLLLSSVNRRNHYRKPKNCLCVHEAPDCCLKTDFFVNLSTEFLQQPRAGAEGLFQMFLLLERLEQSRSVG